MAATITIPNSAVQYDLFHSSRRWLVSQAGLVDTTVGWGIFEGNTWSDNTLVIKGRVQQSASGFYATGVFGESTSIEVAATGRIKGSNAVMLSGDHQSLENAGKLEATEGVAVNAGGDNAHIVNNGDMLGVTRGITLHDGAAPVVINNGLLQGTVGIVYEQDDVRIVNGKAGSIVAVDTGIRNISFAGAHSEIVNHGLINAALGKGLNFGDGAENVVNDGRIRGQILLGGGNDVFDNRDGRIDNGVYGGLGNDTLITDKAGARLFELDGNGTADTVKSSATYTLDANIERLLLLGDANINGTGNTGDNRLAGNAGNNRLSGLAGVDTFVFATHGGHDVVTDFIAHVDKIDLSGLDAITSLHDLKTNHITVAGPDLIIHAGNDTLKLLDTDKNEIQASDFQF